MGSLTYSTHDDYFNGLGSVKMRLETPANGIRATDCELVMNPQGLPANSCKTKWNPDPTHTYRMEMPYNGSFDYVPTVDWSAITGWHFNVIDTDADLRIFNEVAASANIEWLPEVMATASSPSLWQPAVTLKSPIVFLRYKSLLDDTDDDVATCGDSVSSQDPLHGTSQTFEVGDADYTLPAYFETDRSNLINAGGYQSAISYIRFKETFLATMVNQWLNGKMSSTISIQMQIEILECHSITAAITAPPEVPDYAVSFTKTSYTSLLPYAVDSTYSSSLGAQSTSTRSDTYYKALGDYHTEPMDFTPTSGDWESSLQYETGTSPYSTTVSAVDLVADLPTVGDGIWRK